MRGWCMRSGEMDEETDGRRSTVIKYLVGHRAVPRCRAVGWWVAGVWRAFRTLGPHGKGCAGGGTTWSVGQVVLYIGRAVQL